MSYTKYTDQNIFLDQRINAFCDLFFESLETAFPAVDPDKNNDFVFKSTVLTGKAAAILQDEEGDISNVTFICGRENIFSWLTQNLGTNIFKCKQISFKNRILVYPQPDLFFEIWHTPDEPEIIAVEDIYVQILSDIPPQTL